MRSTREVSIMAFISSFGVAPAEWLPVRDRELLDRIAMEDLSGWQGKRYENPDFEMKVVWDVHTWFAADLFVRIRRSDEENKKLVLILPSPENAVYISLTEALNKYSVSCRNVHVFFLYEYANEQGDVAPWQSPYSRSGHFVRWFYEKLRPELRMPFEQLHFFTKENTANYSALIEAEGGADLACTALSWSGGIGAIDAESFAAKSWEEFITLGSRFVTPMPEMIAHDSLRGMFGCSGDIGNVPPCAVTVGPKDILNARELLDVEYMTACGGTPAQQKMPLKLALMAPAAPNNPAALLRFCSGRCLVSAQVAAPAVYRPDDTTIEAEIAGIRAREEAAK